MQMAPPIAVPSGDGQPVVPPGVYTLRLGYQPQDGDHMGTAPHSEFCLACPAAEDNGAATGKKKPAFTAFAMRTVPTVVVVVFCAETVAAPNPISATAAQQKPTLT